MHNFRHAQNNKSNLIITENIKTPISYSDVLGVSITIIALIIILAPFAISESDLYWLKDFARNLIDFDKKTSDSNTITKTINGKSHSITVHLEIEQKANYLNRY